MNEVGESGRARGGRSAREGVILRVTGHARGWAWNWRPEHFAHLQTTTNNARRGVEIWEAGKVREMALRPDILHVQGTGHFYTVDVGRVDSAGRTWPVCDCNYFTYRQLPCKHIMAVVAWLLAGDGTRGKAGNELRRVVDK